MPDARLTTTAPIVSVLAGGVAGGVESLVTYPFEFAKTRIQLYNDSKVRLSRNPYRIVGQLYREEGLRALYKGCGVSIVGSIGKDAVRFASFDMVKNAFRDPETGTLTPGRNLLAGMSAGVFASIFAVTPSERIKTALIDDARSSRRYVNTLHAVSLIVREDGVKGLYRGFVGTTLKQASATSLRMGSYNIIKDFEVARNIRQNTAMNFVNGSAAGVITTLLSQPFDTIKTRSQAARATTTREAITSILRIDGVRGFWRGTVMRLSRTVFSGGILFTTAEAMHTILEPVFARPDIRSDIL